MYSFPQAAINNRERDSRIKNRDLKRIFPTRRKKKEQSSKTSKKKVIKQFKH